MPTRYFPDEGDLVGYRCPRCGSGEITCTQAVYEFTTLLCRACGHWGVMDDLQITDWFAPEN